MEERYLPVFEEADMGETPSPQPKKKPGTAQVVLVQSICCAVLILFFWLFKVMGGTAYTQLRGTFMNALQNNTLFATVAALFDQGEPDESYQLSGGTTAGTTTGTTVNTTGSTTGTTVSTTAGTTVVTTQAAAATTASTAADG